MAAGRPPGRRAGSYGWYALAVTRYLWAVRLRRSRLGESRREAFSAGGIGEFVSGAAPVAHKLVQLGEVIVVVGHRRRVAYLGDARREVLRRRGTSSSPADRELAGSGGRPRRRLGGIRPASLQRPWTQRTPPSRLPSASLPGRPTQPTAPLVAAGIRLFSQQRVFDPAIRTRARPESSEYNDLISLWHAARILWVAGGTTRSG